MLTVDQINALSKRVEELKGYLGVEQKRMEIAEDEKLTQDPEFWNDPKGAEKVMKRMRTKKSWVQAYDRCASAVDDLSVLYEFMKVAGSTRMVSVWWCIQSQNWWVWIWTIASVMELLLKKLQRL